MIDDENIYTLATTYKEACELIDSHMQFKTADGHYYVLVEAHGYWVARKERGSAQFKTHEQLKEILANYFIVDEMDNL